MPNGKNEIATIYIHDPQMTILTIIFRRLICLKAVAKLAVDKFAVVKFAVDKLAVEKFAVGQKCC